MTAETQPAVRAAVGGGGSSIGSFYQYSVGPAVTRALSVPTVSRARDLIASMIGCLDLRSYTLQWSGEEYEKIYVPGESWFSHPDPRVTRNFIMANTFSDLFFTVVAHGLLQAVTPMVCLPVSRGYQWVRPVLMML